MKARRFRRLRSAMSIIVGVVILLTPVVLTQLKNAEQARQADAYSASVAQMDTRAREAMLARAHAYNRSLSVGVRDPWVSQIDTTSEAYREYLSQLDLETVMARVTVPSVGIDLPVYHGTSQKTLATGVGHLYGTALPVGGAGTHTVLTGHTGLATVTMFDNLTHIKVGDVVVVEVVGEKLAYQVSDIETVLPSEVSHVKPVEGQDLLTLITCTPYGINSHRLLVHATRLPVVPTIVVQEYKSPWQPWMVGVVVFCVLSLFYLLFFLVRRRRPAPDVPKGGHR